MVRGVPERDQSLAQGQPQRAVTLLEYAVSQRPQPGRDVFTYAIYRLADTDKLRDLLRRIFG